MNDPRIAAFQQALESRISGEALFDEMSRILYSTDASLYQLMPLGIVLPKTREDVIETVRLASQYGYHLMGRGGGTSLAGQTVSRGIVIDFSKYMNQVLEVNPEERWARIQPGIILDNLNDHLRQYGLFFAPDVATANRANVGGMMGNNSSGVRSIRYGKTVDHVLELSLVLASGETVEVSESDPADFAAVVAAGGRKAQLYGDISGIVSRNREQIIEKFPKVMRRVSGYNLDELLDPSSFNLAKLVVGSEGTLAMVTEAKINLEPIPPYKLLAALHFDDLLTAIRTVKVILDYNPSAVEILDRYALDLGRDNPVVAALCRQFLKGNPESVLIVEFSGESEEQVRRELTSMREDPAVASTVFHIHEAVSEAEQQVIWQVRKNALGVLLSVKGDAKPLPFIEDSAIPVAHLAEYVAEIQELCKKLDRQLAMYAHASVGVIHLRPLLNLKNEEDVQILQTISEEAFKLVQKYGGSWSGEHGDGLVRSYKIPEFYGDQLYQAFREVKATFDPAGIMNPGKIVNPQRMTENLRISPEYKTAFPATYYRFEEEGGFDRAIEMCTGVGQCRKTLVGSMCPSYIATRDEEHSTRGRANALRSAISGKIGPNGFTSQRLYEVMDLCLECKACKSECPSNVDMAKMKAEFLSHYYEEHGVPLRKRLVAATRRNAELASRLPALANFIITNRVSRWLLERIVGFDARRTPPTYARQTLEEWFGKHYRPHPEGKARGKVQLFADTFANYNEPQVGIAAVRVLSHLGYDVELFNPGCCGRPIISAGLLQKARENGARLLKRVADHPDQESPIIVLEPSCYSTFKDDYLDLMEDREGARKLAARVHSIEEFVSREEVFPLLQSSLDPGPSRILFHGHCQQKALTGSDSALKLFRAIPGSQVEEAGPGCCGMAGSFGYEMEHYRLSEKIGRRHLLPAVESSNGATAVAVPGFSCRSQIRHFTNKGALHPAEILATCLRQE